MLILIIAVDDLCWYSTGELYKTTKAYKAVEEDEITLEVGETIEVIHKLLDGWWVVRYETCLPLLLFNVSWTYINIYIYSP